LIKSKIEELSREGKSIIFSASPRTLYEAEKLMPILEGLYKKYSKLVKN
jgi:hypothetical protein